MCRTPTFPFTSTFMTGEIFVSFFLFSCISVQNTSVRWRHTFPRALRLTLASSSNTFLKCNHETCGGERGSSHASVWSTCCKSAACALRSAARCANWSRANFSAPMLKHFCAAVSVLILRVIYMLQPVARYRLQLAYLLKLHFKNDSEGVKCRMEYL